MKKAHAKSILIKLMRIWPKGFPPMDDMEVAARVEDLMEAFGELAYKDVDAAINELMKTQTFLPSIAEILQAVQAVKAAQTQSEAPNDFWDEDGYHYKRIDGHMVCVERPRRTPLKDPELQAFLDEKRRIYAEAGAPKTYTMRQVRELARQKGIELEEQQDMAVLAKLTGGRA
jgi:hypothetical protein